MTVRVYQWAIEVTLIKMVKRGDDGLASRYSGADREINLTPFLGDGGAVQTTKSLRGEAAGAFSISFGDQIEQNALDSVYELVEPMDMIVIRASREPNLYVGTALPIIMRGFVSSIRRSESVGGDGQPDRTVTVSGHDFGKLWNIHAVWYELSELQELQTLTTFGLLAAIGMDVSVVPIETFMAEFVTKIMNPRVAAMAEYSQKIVADFSTEISVKQGKVLPSVMSQLSGTYWNIVTSVCDQPWNEIFIRDDESGPCFVFRPAPFKNLDGKLILDDAADPGTVDVTIDEVVQWDVNRSDSRVANFFWTPPGGSTLDTNAQATASAIVDGSALDFQYGNNRPELYGEKKMECPSALIPDDSDGVPEGQSGRLAEAARHVEWHRKRANELRDMNRDNSVLEDGAAVVMGSEDLAIGTYLRLLRGGLQSESYIVAVSHTFQSYGPWTTTLQLERGTGFLVRTRLEKSPYVAEGRRGPYSPAIDRPPPAAKAVGAPRSAPAAVPTPAARTPAVPAGNVTIGDVQIVP